MLPEVIGSGKESIANLADHRGLGVPDAPVRPDTNTYSACCVFQGSAKRP